MSHSFQHVLFVIGWLVTMGVAPCQRWGYEAESSNRCKPCKYGCGKMIDPMCDSWHMCEQQKEARPPKPDPPSSPTTAFTAAIEATRAGSDSTIK